MTEEERKMLRALYAALCQPRADGPPLIDRLEGLYEALLEVPVGADKEAKPLLTRINAVVQLHERANWTLRAAVYLVSAFGAIAGGLMAVRGFWR